MTSESPHILSSNSNIQSPVSPSFSHYSAVSPRAATSPSAPLTPPLSRNSTPNLSGRSLSIKRKPVPTYLGDESILSRRTTQTRNSPMTYTLSGDRPAADVEVLQSPVQGESNHGSDDRMSEHSTPSFSGFTKQSPHLVRSTSARSSKSLPSHQSRNRGIVSPSREILPSNSHPIENTAALALSGQAAKMEEEEARRPSQASTTSSVSTVDSDFTPTNGSRPPSAARSIVLGRPMNSSDIGNENDLSSQHLFTSFPNTQPNARIQQLRAARMQPGADGDTLKTQAPAMVRIPTDKSIDKQMSALGITTRTGDTAIEGDWVTGLTGLGIRGAELTPTLPAETSENHQSNQPMLIPNPLGIYPIDTRLNHSLPSLPLDPTRSNLTAPAMQREKGLFRRKKVKAGDEFSEHAVPTPMRLWEASQCHIVDESGQPRRFGDFWDTFTVTPQDDLNKDGAKGKFDRRSVKSLTRDVIGGQHHPHRNQADSASSSRLSFHSAGKANTRDKNGFGRKGHKPRPDDKIGGEEYIVHGRKTVVFWIRHFWCGQCA